MNAYPGNSPSVWRCSSGIQRSPWECVESDFLSPHPDDSLVPAVETLDLQIAWSPPLASLHPDTQKHMKVYICARTIYSNWKDVVILPVQQASKKPTKVHTKSPLLQQPPQGWRQELRFHPAGSRPNTAINMRCDMPGNRGPATTFTHHRWPLEINHVNTHITWTSAT